MMVCRIILSTITDKKLALPRRINADERFGAGIATERTTIGVNLYGRTEVLPVTWKQYCRGTRGAIRGEEITEV